MHHFGILAVVLHFFLNKKALLEKWAQYQIWQLLNTAIQIRDFHVDNRGQVSR
jgi:hypothetical protein